MADLTITASRVAPVRLTRDPRSFPAAVTITAGQAVYLDSTNALRLADADADATENAMGIALRSVVAGETTSIAAPDDLIDLGDALGGLAYGAPVYLSGTAGGLADAAGSASVVMGRVEGVHSQTSGTADKLLRLSGSLPG
jgi:hypothetical protein